MDKKKRYIPTGRPVRHFALEWDRTPNDRTGNSIAERVQRQGKINLGAIGPSRWKKRETTT